MWSSSRFVVSSCAIAIAHAHSANVAIGLAKRLGAVVRRTIPARFNALAKRSASPSGLVAVLNVGTKNAVRTTEHQHRYRFCSCSSP